MAFNELTDAEAERLAMLAEEASEIGQAVGKILRHGYRRSHPDNKDVWRNNRSDLAREIGDLLGIADQMMLLDDINSSDVDYHRHRKWGKALKYTHHQGTSHDQ